TEGGHDGGEVQVTFAGKQVLVAVVTHALEVHVHDLARGAPDGFWRAFLGHVCVTDIQSETEARLSDPVAYPAETRQVLDVHAGLGLEAQDDAVLGQPGADRLRLLGRRTVVRIERPGIEGDGDALEAEPGDDLERIAQAVGSEAVGVVAETHLRWDCTCAGAPLPAT